MALFSVLHRTLPYSAHSWHLHNPPFQFSAAHPSPPVTPIPSDVHPPHPQWPHPSPQCLQHLHDLPSPAIYCLRWPHHPSMLASSPPTPCYSSIHSKSPACTPWISTIPHSNFHWKWHCGRGLVAGKSKFLSLQVHFIQAQGSYSSTS
jgi:hypothetical protein